jgi:hypothetical protein
MNPKIRALLRQASDEAIDAIRSLKPERAAAHQARSTELSIEAARLLAATDRPSHSPRL